MDDLPDPEAESRALVRSDPDSPWPHMLLAITTIRGTKASLDAAAELGKRLDRVGGARQRALRAVHTLLERYDVDEAMKELRKAYGEDPNDADTASIYAANAIGVGAYDEGFSVVDRLAEKFPTHALLAIENAVTTPPRHDLERDERYLARLIEVLPDKRCGDTRLNQLLAREDIAGARGAVVECAAFFGPGKPSLDHGLDLWTAAVDLFSGEHDAAHAAAMKRMGDPQPGIRILASSIAFGSYFAAGRVAEGLETLKGEFARQRDEDSPLVAMQDALALLRVHRRLGTRPPPDVVAWLAKLGHDTPSLPRTQRLAIDVVVLLARGELARAGEILKQIEAADDPVLDLASIPLHRAMKNDRAAVLALRRRLPRAGDQMLRGVAIDAALALEATRADPKEIRGVLKVLRSPYASGVSYFDATVAEAVLARVSDAEGKPEEAAEHRARLARWLAKADAGVADAIGKMR